MMNFERHGNKAKQLYLQHPMSLTYKDSILTSTTFSIGMQHELPNKVVNDDFKISVYIVIKSLSAYLLKLINP